MNYKEKLVEYGLSENEAAIYLAAMELGPSPVQKIAEKAKVNRVSTYNFIKSLTLKGLMSSYEEGKKTMYVASDPSRLFLLFEKQNREINERAKELETLLPRFKSLYNTTSEKPIVRYYEGLDGVLVMHEDVIEQANATIEMIYNLDQIEKYIPPEIKKNLTNKRLSKNIKTKVIYSSSDKELKSSVDGERYRLLDQNLPIESDITIYNDKVRLISFGDTISGIVIENKQISNTLRTLFKLAIKSIEK